MAKNEHRLDGLTSLRFFACLLVILYHFGGRGIASVPIVRAFVPLGYLGIVFFFVLSGFVLTAVYVPRARVRPINSRSFYAARFARIYPVYLLSIVFSLVLLAFGIQDEISKVGSSAVTIVAAFLRLTFLSSWIPGFALALNGPAWTLSVEAFFYAVFPLLLFWMLRGNTIVRRGLVVAANLACAAIPFAIRHLDQSRSTHLYNFIRYFPPLHFGTFLVGCEIGLYYVDRRRDSRERDWLTMGFALSLIVLGSLLLVPSFPQTLLQNGLVAIPFGIVVLWFAENEDRVAVMRWTPLVLLGEASYGAYILQFPLRNLFAVVSSKLGLAPVEESVSSLSVYLAALFVVALVSYHLYERPARAFLRSRLEPKGSPESKTVESAIETPQHDSG